mmetsp:Transcript_27593/g.78068  ORF Transcript_27593/g.78068 Transcript_27593/m.78068 type:complete len:201 (-) Transcript_27593:641-1243(-)
MKCPEACLNALCEDRMVRMCPPINRMGACELTNSAVCPCSESMMSSHDAGSQPRPAHTSRQMSRRSSAFSSARSELLAAGASTCAMSFAAPRTWSTMGNCGPAGASSSSVVGLWHECPMTTSSTPGLKCNSKAGHTECLISSSSSTTVTRTPRGTVASQSLDWMMHSVSAMHSSIAKRPSEHVPTRLWLPSAVRQSDTIS